MVYLSLDIGPIIELAKEFQPAVHKAMEDATRDLAMATHAHVIENVQRDLHSTRQKYIDALSFSQVSKDTWVISLDKSALWIEDGMPEHSMLPDLLKSPKAKTAQDGSKYIVVPFSHNQGPTQQTPAQQTLTATVKAEMKKRKIPYGKLEMGSDGKPKTGLLHSFDVMRQPVKTKEGPGQGHGAIGDVRQGPTGTPFLQGIRVYQKSVTDKSGKASIKKQIVTFRVASSKMTEDHWKHPGLEAKNFLGSAYDWALDLWETKIRDQVLIQISRNF